MNNLHIHLIYSERKELAEPVVKIASREDWAKAWERLWENSYVGALS